MDSTSAREKNEVLSPAKAKLSDPLTQQSHQRAQRIVPFPRDHRADRIRLPCSGAQQRLWFIDQLEGGSTAYHIPLGLSLRGELNPQALQEALDSIVERHEILRSVFVLVDGTPMQEVHREASFKLASVEICAQSDEERQALVLDHARDELLTPFDLIVGPLIRGRLLRLSPDEHVLLITMHHMTSDGWSVSVLRRELAMLYAVKLEGRAAPLPALPIQYGDYAQWQQHWRAELQPHLSSRVQYWKEHLQGSPELIELPTDRVRPALQSHNGASVQVSLGTELTAHVRSLSRRLNLTIAMALYAAWSVVLARISGHEDIVVGMPVANRSHAELEGLIGLFVNTVAVRLRLEDDPSVSDLLQRVKAVMLDTYAHQDVPFEQVVEALHPVRSRSYNPIFQVMFALNTPATTLQLPGLQVTEQEVPWQTAQFDLTLSLQEVGANIAGHLNYATDLFDAATIQRWAACFKTVLRSMVRLPAVRVSQLPLLSDSERRQVLELFNRTQTAAHPDDRLLDELFEQQVERIPDALAVTYEGQSLTYAELNGKANQLGWYLRGQGIGPDQLVALCVERSLDLAVGLLGIIKAGAAYLPLDPNYPPDRLEYMLDDAQPRLLLTQERLRDRLPHTEVKLLTLDDQWAEVTEMPTCNLHMKRSGLRSNHLAYVIYTSGSTGKPKGVMVEHRNVTRLFGATSQWFDFNERDVWTLFHSFAFDFSVWELWGALLYGGRVVIVPYLTARSPQEFYRLLCEQGVTVLNQTPSAFVQLIDAQTRCAGMKHSLRVVVFGGEALELHTLQPWVDRNGADKPQLVNMYGITETTVHVTYRRLTRREIESERGSLIGRPIPDLQVYLLDRHKQPVPIGVAGEIYVGGGGVARGYLNRPELTAQRFVTDPFSNKSQACLYRSGDLARWREDGTLEYLGRNDDQVKIRGFRIELGEIEALLARHDKVKDGIVIAREDAPGEKRLVAYVVPVDPFSAPDIEELRAHLKVLLPEYMVPSAFVTLERLPLTSNGKLDRRALPAPELGAFTSRQYEAPQGEVEELLAGIWYSLLRIDRVGRHDNFFELGGHSLLIVQMMERLRRVGLATDVRRVFESPNLMDLAKTLTRDVVNRFEVPPSLIPADCAEIRPQMLPLVELEDEHIARIVQSVPGGATNIQDVYPLVPLQEGILFHRLLNERGGDTYVVPIVLSVSSRERLDALIAGLQAVIQRHDILRTAVLWEQLPRPVQVVYRRAVLPVEEITLDPSRDVKEQIEEWMKPERQQLDLRQAPLMRLRVTADASCGQWYALLQFHHIAIDHVTLEILTAEIMAHIDGNADRLAEPVPYRNHVAQCLAYAQEHDAEAFFRSKLADIDEPTAPFGLVDVHGDGTQMEEAREELDPTLSHRVRAQARRLGVSAATLFHAGWALVLAHTSGRDDVVFGSLLLGRLQGSAGAQRIVGVFINTLPLRLSLGGMTAKELVEQTQRELIELLGHEQASLAMAQRCSGIVGSAPLFNALMNYRHSVPNPDAQWSSAKGIEMLTSQERTNYPIALSVDDLGEGFLLTAQTDRRIDPHRITSYLHVALRSLIAALEGAPRTAALALQILPDDERQRVLESFNATGLEVPREKLVHQLVEMQVARAPDAVALICKERELTYAQLNRRANQLARVLWSYGVRPDQRVALFIERDLELVVGLLAILKAGGAYLPLDVNYPAERIAYMLRDSAASVILTQSQLASALPETAARVVVLDTIENELAQMPDTNLDARQAGLHPQNVAYVIYTSGSTGTPKGVMIEHVSAVNMIQWSRADLGFAEGSRSSSVASVGFDAAGWEIWPALSAGGTLFLASSDMIRDPEALVNWWATQPLDISFLSTPLAEFAFSRNIRNRQLKTLLVGGDRLRHRPESKAFSLVNNYGPTEAAVVATSGRVRDEDDSIDIGKPIANTRIYILGSRAQPAPVGVAGEIYIAGAGLARGYLNRPGLTAERFVPDPFSDDPIERMYKTGDLGRWRADGAIEYVGRNDHQIKIRGYRIELGEIEAQLSRHARVRDVVVMAREDIGGVRLAAYVVPEAALGTDTPLSAEELRGYLKSVLPDYMVPSAFVMLEELPLTPNGKVDRRALPAPEFDAYLSRQYEAPRGDVEEILAGIWQGLLGVERVGRRDNFFELGGHSLLIVQMRERLRRVGLSAGVRTVFESATLADLASALTPESLTSIEVAPNLIPHDCEAITPEMLPLVELNEQHIELIVSSVPGGAANIQDIYPLAPLQEGILFHHLLDPQGGDAYVLASLFSVASRERLAQLIAALQAVIDRHDVLRTALLWEELPQPVQVVYRKAVLPVVEVNLDPHREVTEQIKEWLRPGQQRLDLRHAPLLRLQIAPDPHTAQWYALMQLHHITCDHVTAEIIDLELTAELKGNPPQLVRSVPYRNHVAQALRHAQLNDAEKFFRQKLGDIDEPTAPFGLVDTQGRGTQIAKACAELDSELAQLVRRHARRLGVSAATLFHTAWGLVIAHTSGRDDVVFGTVLLGRLQGSAGAQRILGMFINTLPLRLQLQSVSVKDLVERTQRELVELLGHEQTSLALAQRCSRVRGSVPLFSALLNYRHSSPNDESLWGGVEGFGVCGGYERTNYPITLSVDDFGDRFALTSQTDHHVDPQRMIEYLRTALLSTVQALEGAPQTLALDLSIMPSRERQQLMQGFNATRSTFQREKLIHQLFEEQVARTPNAIAVEHAEESLTYAKLDAQADRLAAHLRRKGVCADRLVGICAERSVEMVVALLAILKAGAAYLPLDPNYPAERLQHMMEDAAPHVVLTQKALMAGLPATQAELIDLTAGINESTQGVSEGSATTQSPSSLVYVIYTSGSTGRPKGTAMEHRAMVNLMEWHREGLGARAGQRVLQFAALSFDVAFQEIFSTLCTGGTLVMLDEWVRRDAGELLKLLNERSIERIFVPPLVLQSMAECFANESSGVDSLRDVIAAGEQLRISPEIRTFFKRLNHCRLHNHYGPTETHVVSALTLSDAPEEWPTLPSIGRPVPNVQLHVLNERRQHVPMGVAGEIYVGGVAIARGYLRRPELTKQRFIPDPFSPAPEAGLYKTGDLGRWLPDGTIEYLGRNDDQVKVRGYRIELGEVEARLCTHASVKEAAVVAREDAPGERRLVAYVTTRETDDQISQELRSYLKEALPDYMVPSAFVVLESLPLTPSGKLNRRALPAPELGAYATLQYEVPQGAVEQALAAIWQEVLGVARVGRTDNFFELGGHSLLVLKALVKINAGLAVNLRVTDVYKSPTVQELALRISAGAVTDDFVDLAREAILDPEIFPLQGLPQVPARHVLLTGATGFVGRFLLAQLLEDTEATIHCLVRAQSAQQAFSRLKATLLKWDLWRDGFAERIIAIPGDLRLPLLGIAEETWDQLCSSIDCVYHCATSMNHLETYAMAKPANVGSAKELLKLATRHRPKTINYISTLGVFGSSATEAPRTVDEYSPLDQEKHSTASGYLASKWVSEKIFLAAGERGIPCNIFRLGLVWADAQSGRFDELQSVYRVLKTCLLSGFGIEGYRYPMAPIPVDYVAQSVVVLSTHHPEGQHVFHLTSSAQRVENVFELCGEMAGISLELMPFYDWIAEVKRLCDEGQSLPAAPIIDYAFSMDETSFHEHQRNVRSAANVRFDSTSTDRELARLGIVARVLDEGLLRATVEDMLWRDRELQDLTGRASPGDAHAISSLSAAATDPSDSDRRRSPSW